MVQKLLKKQKRWDVAHSHKLTCLLQTVVWNAADPLSFTRPEKHLPLHQGFYMGKCALLDCPTTTNGLKSEQRFLKQLFQLTNPSPCHAVFWGLFQKHNLYYTMLGFGSYVRKEKEEYSFNLTVCYHPAHSSKATSRCGTWHCVIREFPPWVKLHVVVLVLFPSRINCALTRSIHLILSFHSLIHGGRISTTALTASHALISFPS